METLRRATDALNDAKRAGDKKGEVAAAIRVAEARLVKDGPEVTLQAATEAQALASKLQDPKTEAQVMSLLAKVHIAGGKGQEAVQASTGMLELARKASDSKQAAAAHCFLALGHDLNGDSDEAVKEAKEAVKLYREAGGALEEAASLLTLAQVQLSEPLANNYDRVAQAQLSGSKAVEAERSAKWALKLFREKGHSKGAGTALGLYVQALVARGMVTEARSAAEQEILAFRAAGDKLGEAAAAHAVAVAALASGEPDFGAVETALGSVQALGYRREEGRLLVSLASAQSKQGLVEQAQRNANKAVSIFRKVGDWEGEKSALEILTSAHAAMGLEPPSSPFRTEALEVVAALAKAVEMRDAKQLSSAVVRIYKAGGFFMRDDFIEVLGPVVAKDTEGAAAFLRDNCEEGVADFFLDMVSPKQADSAETAAGPVGDGIGPAKETQRAREINHTGMYYQVRAGTLVYGPHYRQVNGFILDFNKPFEVVHATVTPTSLGDDWQQEGFDWNPACIDAAVHATFGMGHIDRISP
jgi:tetratricopeptide (TPR) repeat protein